MKILKKIILCCFVILSLLFTNYQNVDAAGISVTPNVNSVKVGSTFTVTIRGSGNVFIDGLSVSCTGGEVVSQPSRRTLEKGESASATIRLTSESGATVSVSGNAANYETETEYSVNGSCTVRASIASSSSSGGSTSRPSQEPQDDPRSKNNNLSSLSINHGTLSPKFSADKTEYKVSLAADISEISIDAKAADSKAKVSGTGKHTLKAGKNIIKVVCTSEYGTKREYIVEVTVDEKPLVFLEYNKVQLGVVRNLDGLKVPDGFKETTVKVNDKDVPAWTHEKMGKTIVYLMNDKNEKNYYVYDNGKITSVFKPITLLNIPMFIVDIDEKTQIRNGMKYTEIEIDKQKLMGWIFEDKAFENYSLIYVMNLEGQMQYYQYEKTSNTLQPYSQAAPVTEETYNQLIKDNNNQKMMTIAFGIVSAVLLIGGITYYFMKIRVKKTDDA